MSAPDEQITRYKIDAHKSGFSVDPAWSGRWVGYEDHLADKARAVETLEARIERLTSEIDRMGTFSAEQGQRELKALRQHLNDEWRQKIEKEIAVESYIVNTTPIGDERREHQSRIDLLLSLLPEETEAAFEASDGQYGQPLSEAILRRDRGYVGDAWRDLVRLASKERN